MSQRRVPRGLAIVLLVIAGCSTEDTDVVSERDASQPPVAELDGATLVSAHCGGCHSLALVATNRGDRDDWLATIRWMQKTQGLWELDPATESTILDYLAQSYPPTNTGRRAPLPEHLLPPSATESRATL